MRKILIVEDSSFFSKLLEKRVREDLGYEVVCARTMDEVKDCLEDNPSGFFLSLLDLTIPGASEGQVVDYVTSKNVPAIVFTGSFEEETRKKILEKNIIDYVVKNTPGSLDYLIRTIKGLSINQNVKVLVVDDSRVSRIYVSNLMKRNMFQVFEADNGLSALKVLEEYEDIKVVVTDYNMPEMDGFELTKSIRKKHHDRRITIIGISGQENDTLSVKFIKNGADDFILKPFQEEEFICRISRNVESINLLEKVQENMEKIEAAYSTIEKDLKAAENLQKSHLPAPKKVSENIEFGSMFIPSAFVSGDFYNYYTLKNNVHAFYSIDVSGHGVPSALLSVTLANLITTDYIQDVIDKCFAKSGINTSLGQISIEIVNNLNARFQINDEINQYFTIAFGLIEGNSGKVGFCQAGHPNPVILRKEGNVEIVGEGGVPVGFLDDPDYESCEIELKKGDRLFFYSDGITECENESGVQLEEDRFTDILLKGKNSPLEKTFRTLDQDLKVWRGKEEFSDDVSMMGLELLS